MACLPDKKPPNRKAVTTRARNPWKKVWAHGIILPEKEGLQKSVGRVKMAAGGGRFFALYICTDGCGSRVHAAVLS